MKRLLVVTLILIAAGFLVTGVSVERREPAPPRATGRDRFENHLPKSSRSASRVHFAHGPRAGDNREMPVDAEADEDPTDDDQDVPAFAGGTPEGNATGIHVFAGEAHASIDASGVHVSVGSPPTPPQAPAVPAVPELRAERETPGISTHPVARTEIVELTSDWKVDPEQARNDLGRRIESRLTEWLSSAGVPALWHPPADLLQTVVRGDPVVASEDRGYDVLYRASQSLDLSPERKHELVSAYRRHLAGVWLGGGLLFTLASLGIVGGYIRTDEATKGYYTNRLRLAAAAGLGGAGVLLVQWILRAS